MQPLNCDHRCSIRRVRGGRQMETTAGDETVPRELVVVQALVNTIDLEDNDDRLDSPEALRSFLTGHGLLGGGEPVGQADLDLAVELREALRAMLRVNHGEPLDPAALEVRPAPRAPGNGSRPARPSPASGPSTTGPRTAPAAGARCRPAATAPRPAPTAAAAAPGPRRRARRPRRWPRPRRGRRGGGRPRRRRPGRGGRRRRRPRRTARWRR